MKHLWKLAFFLMAAACAGPPPPGKTGERPPQFLSLSPASLGRSLSLSQLVTGEHDDRIYKIRYELDITPARLALVGLSPLGVTLFTIVVEKGKLTTESLVKGGGGVKGQVGFDPRYTLFDLYLTYWPKDVLQAALAPLKMILQETADGSVRRVTGLEGELIAEITYPTDHRQKGDILIQHFNVPYRIRVQTLSRGRAP